MDCLHARSSILDARRDRLGPADREALRVHLASCAACARADAAEGALDDLLDRELPRRPASAELVARLERMVRAQDGIEVPGPAAHPGKWTRFLAPALAACLALTLGGVFVERSLTRASEARATFLSEAVSDHLRAVASSRGPELASSANHEVKPWFEGRVDFAPVVPSPGTPQLRIVGGSVGYFLDRRAAVVSYALRRHAVTLLAFRADGLDLPEGAGADGKVALRTGGVRGFHVAAWRSGDLGYALVSDVAPAELDDLAATFATATRRTD